MATKIGFAPTGTSTSIAVTTGDANIDDITPRAQPGTKYWYYDSAKNYCEAVYVQFVDAIAYVKGGMVFLADDNTVNTPQYIVTNDYSEDLGDILAVAGVCYGVQTTGRYGFVQVYGPGIVLNNNDDDAAIGNELIVTAADNGVANVATAGASGAQIYIGFATSAVDTGTNLCRARIGIRYPWWNE
jgi:hypothetical protein